MRKAKCSYLSWVWSSSPLKGTLPQLDPRRSDARRTVSRYSWHPMHVQGSSYQNIRETQCVCDEAIACSKERIVAGQIQQKAQQSSICALVKEQHYFGLLDASKYLASLRKKRQSLILQFTKSNSDMNSNSQRSMAIILSLRSSLQINMNHHDIFVC